MTRDFLPQFRRRLFDWLQFSLANERMPFRRVEETPRLVSDAAPGTPDLVLWVNRDSLIAGAMILIPHRVDPVLLHEAGIMAGSLGLRQFATWGIRGVDIWEIAEGGAKPLRSWAIPAAGHASTEAFTEVFDQLLQALKELSISAMLPADQLPPVYFANLCRLVWQDVEPALLSSSRVAAPAGQADALTLRQARDKGWLSLWRLLTLLWHDRMPPGINPERLERAFGYALADLDPDISRYLQLADHEPPLPESAAVRLHHLAGRISQLGWQRDRQRAIITLDLLLAETARDCRVRTTPLAFPPGTLDLLVNHMPPQLPAAAMLLVPRPCLAGLALTSLAAGAPMPAWAADRLTALPVDCSPERIVASLHDSQPLPPNQRRRRLAALRGPWPYRRFQLSAGTPAWLWEALHLGGIVNAQGSLLLTLPANWVAAADAELLWRALTERHTLAGVRLHEDGRQTLTLVDRQLAPDTLEIHLPDGTCRQLPPLPDDAEATALATLSAPATVPSEPPLRNRRTLPKLAETIAAKVFRDGLPNFPGDYLRRVDQVQLRTYRIPGLLHADSHFFDRVCLRGPDGTLVEAENLADAEALLLASRDGRAQVDLPVDPILTARLTAAYRNDLKLLWQALLDECRRHHPVQRRALALARKLWRERHLPAQETS